MNYAGEAQLINILHVNSRGEQDKERSDSKEDGSNKRQHNLLDDASLGSNRGATSRNELTVQGGTISRALEGMK